MKTLYPAVPKKIHTVVLQHMLDWMFFTSDQEPGVQLPVLVVYDLSTGAVMAMQSTKDSSVVTVGAVVQTLETWGHTVVLHADGEPATKSLVRSVANARVHRTLPRHGPPHSHPSRDLLKHAFRFTVESLWQTSWLWKQASVVVCC